MDHGQIQVSVIVEIRRRHAATDVLAAKVVARSETGFVPAVSIKAEQLGRHGQGHAQVSRIVEMPVGNEQIVAPILIEILHHGPEADERQLLRHEADERRDVLESRRPQILIQRVPFAFKMRDINVEPAIAVVITQGNSHVGLRPPVGARGTTQKLGFVPEASVPLIHEQKIRGGIVGHEDIGPAVVREIRDHHSHRPIARAEQSALARYR